MRVRAEGRGDKGKFYVLGDFLGRKWVVESMLGGGGRIILRRHGGGLGLFLV